MESTSGQQSTVRKILRRLKPTQDDIGPSTTRRFAGPYNNPHHARPTSNVTPHSPVWSEAPASMRISS